MIYDDSLDLNSAGPCWGRHCPGPCVRDDCYLERIKIGLVAMAWPEDSFGPEPPMSRYVENALREMFEELDKGSG